MITNEIATNPLRIVDTLCVVWRNNSENVEYYAVIEVMPVPNVSISQISGVNECCGSLPNLYIGKAVNVGNNNETTIYVNSGRHNASDLNVTTLRIE